MNKCSIAGPSPQRPMNSSLLRGRGSSPAPRRTIFPLRRRPVPLTGAPAGEAESGASVFVFLDALLKEKKQTLRSLRRTHASLAVGGLLHDPHLGARLIVRYSDLGDLPAAHSVFREIGGSSSFLWNTMVRACALAGHFSGTLELHSSMRRGGIPANNYTYPFVLKAWSSTPGPATGGMSVHGEMLKTGFSSNAHAQVALLSMYAKSGEIAYGRKVFEDMPDRDLVSWTAMITAYEQSSAPEESLRLFRQMQKADDLAADRVTAISVASAIAQLGDSPAARSLHSHAIRRGFLSQDVSVWNAILGMHAKCGDLELARNLFDAMPERDGISWNAMLSGYAQNGRGGEAMALLAEMLAAGVEPNFVTFLAAASACAQLGSLRLARRLHCLIIFSGDSETSDELQNAVTDMYAKCGDLETAVGVFRRRRVRDVNCWNVMIAAHGLHGRAEEALQLFRRMTGEEGLSPDHISFTVVLSACSHGGLVEEGKQIFTEMREKLKIQPMAKHYACMVDLLGRAGRLEEAKELIAGMAAPPSDAIWGALLGGCRIHGNREMAELAAGGVFFLDPQHSGYYVLMSNIYAASARWPEARRVREAMRGRGVKKVAAFSVVEIGRQVQGFFTGDRRHPERAGIYRKAAELAQEMAAFGYRPETACVLQDVEEEDKEGLLALHSEKLAVAYGVMRLGAPAVIRVTMNLRICRDCHGAFKALSLMGGWRIILRDTNRFHHFAGGACSCKDYW